MKKTKIISLMIVVTALFLGGLLPLSAYSEERQILINEKLPSPKTGLGHAIGDVHPIEKGLPVYLFPKERVRWSWTQGEETPVYPDLKPVATTDENGKWVALNVKPGHYCVLHFDPNHQTLALTEADFKEVKKGIVNKFPTGTPPPKNR